MTQANTESQNGNPQIQNEQDEQTLAAQQQDAFVNQVVTEYVSKHLATVKLVETLTTRGYTEEQAYLMCNTDIKELVLGAAILQLLHQTGAISPDVLESERDAEQE